MKVIACLFVVVVSASALSLRASPKKSLIVSKKMITISKSAVDGPCGPQTKVGISHSTVPGTTDPVYEAKPAASGNLEVINPRVETVQVCGPGEFAFSPMQCAGGRFEYKAETITVKNTEGGGCKEVDLEHFAHCYKVSC